MFHSLPVSSFLSANLPNFDQILTNWPLGFLKATLLKDCAFSHFNPNFVLIGENWLYFRVQTTAEEYHSAFAFALLIAFGRLVGIGIAFRSSWQDSTG